ncbi:MAG: histidine kinase, partial [Pseudomonadota bacterium]
EALKFQVHPHFLFNTLGAVSSLVSESEFSKAEEMVRKLASFLRSGLRRDTHDDVSLTEEIADLDVYLGIERIRFEGRFDFVTSIADDVRDARLPSFLLQPIVENSVKYAVAKTSEPVTITLGAMRVADHIEVTVEDNGPGPSGTPGLGTGERNVRDRLTARFGEAIEFETGGIPGADGNPAGYRVWMRFPYEADR